jgi:DNA mismatch repair protein MutS
MMRQYRRIKRGLSDDTVLFFRLGDFYEMFYEDAKVASEILDIALTKRQHTPMCGVPYHQLEPYLAKMVRAGRKVAICEQVEDPAAAKGIVQREVTRVVTPGAVLEEQILDAKRNNYLAGLASLEGVIGFALLDVSTGEFWMEESSEPSAVADHLRRYAPAECVGPAEQLEDAAWQPVLAGLGGRLLTRQDDWTFDPDVAAETLTRHFRVQSLTGFGCPDRSAAVCAAGGMLHYVTTGLHQAVRHIRCPRLRNPSSYMVLDEATLASLDLIPGRTALGERPAPSLLQVLDTTRTAMGGRTLRSWLLRPLRRLDEIQRRHHAVRCLTDHRNELHSLREVLGGVKDVERLIARIGAGRANARDVRAIGLSLAQLGPLTELLAAFRGVLLEETAAAITPLPDLVAWIDRALVEEPPATVREGGIISEGYHAELDALREDATDGRRRLAEFQAQEQARTGIKSLKVRHNKVFGYYIEITKANLEWVPEGYQRKQTLVNAERFVTPGLKELENRILGAQDRARDLEYELFVDVREGILAETEAIQASAEAVAAIDGLACLAERALRLRYQCPVMTDNTELHIRDGRHPVLEQMSEADPFVPNDTHLDTLENQLLILTGPNMAGKSTYIRQTACIVIMAQMGSFVPAAESTIGVVDRVFSRVGASDDLARGRSTFMVEMQETANILHNATARSLIILDEIGRGTSTFDGISIAWAVAEYLHNQPQVKAKTLFATHYHELTDLSLTLPGVKNYTVQVKEAGDRVVFLRKIAPGTADKSYGIHVASLAGLPEAVIARAREILANLEESEFGEDREPMLAKHRPRRLREQPDQLTLF